MAYGFQWAPHDLDQWLSELVSLGQIGQFWSKSILEELLIIFECPEEDFYGIRSVLRLMVLVGFQGQRLENDLINIFTWVIRLNLTDLYQVIQCEWLILFDQLFPSLEQIIEHLNLLLLLIHITSLVQSIPHLLYLLKSSYLGFLSLQHRQRNLLFKRLGVAHNGLGIFLSRVIKHHFGIHQYWLLLLIKQKTLLL